MAVFDDDRDGLALGLGSLFAALVAISIWSSAVAYAAQFAVGRTGDVPHPLIVLSGLTSILGLALGSAAYVRHRDLDLGLSLPSRESLPTALAVVFAPAALAVGASLVGNMALGVPLAGMSQRWISPDLSVPFLLGLVVLPAAFVGLGYGFLFCGAVYERVCDLVGPGNALPVAVALVGFFWLLPVEALAGVRPTPGGLFELGVSLVFGVAFGMALGVLSWYTGDDTAELADRHLVVLGVALFGVLGVGTDLLAFPRAVGDLLWVVALAVALLGYERTRSVWVSAAAIAVFQVATSAVVYVEATLGLAAVP